MKEKSTSINIVDNNVCNVKGKTRIEITSIATGEKKVFEYENTFQSAVLSNILRSLGAYSNSPWVNSTWAGRQLWRNLCGGIFLFRDEITVPNEYMPAGNVMIGNGAYQVTNAGNPQELGSYNEIESSTSGANSLTFVYDWGTSQGNGTISCICLTSEVGGYVGYGNANGWNVSALRSLIENQNSREDTNGIAYKNKLYKISRNESAKKLIVTKKAKPIDEVSIFDGQKTETIAISYSATLWETDGGDYSYIGNGKFAFFPNKSTDNQVAPSGTYTFLIYDAENDTVTAKTITNVSANTLKIATNVAGGIHSLCEYDAENDVFFAPSNSQYNTSALPVNVIYVTDGTAETVDAGVKVSDTVQIFSRIASGIFGMLATSGGLIFYDVVGKTAYKTNASNNLYMYNDEVDAFYTDRQNGGYLYKNPMYLATINNLDSAITKDNTQTMKVIYTLTEA